MRMLACLRKTLVENVRDWKILILTLSFAPFFVYLMYGYLHTAPASYTLLVLNDDRAASPPRDAAGADGLIAAWTRAGGDDGRPVFAVRAAGDRQAAERMVKTREADLLVVIPAGFSARLAALRAQPAGPPPRLTNHHNAANPRSMMAMAMSDYVAFLYASAAASMPSPLAVDARAVDPLPNRSDFDLYVPALLVLAVIMVLFTAAASLIREVDKGTMTRLTLSRVATWELLAAVTITQVLIGAATVLLAYAAASSVGYRALGSPGAALAVTTLATVSVVAIGVLVSAFMRTVFELLTVGCFPFFILMFFSDVMIPLPRIPVLSVAGNAVNLSDVLPTSLAVRALNRVLNDGAGLGDVCFEMTGMALLAAAYFSAGILLFRRRHLRTN
ncbi:MAG TPA: ABC transporter permease [Vicinamibacterales bacterium]|nr:ABC transporter permease [Vicinamibacterales bacterium]HOQ59110.1 ABC transporter permease [Vicinamibacterales bacterium]HPK73016.1 ABC transporter permease [Vicinamibacterales bacterium]